MILNKIKVVILLLISVILFSCSYVADKSQVDINQEDTTNITLQNKGIIKVAVILPLSGKNQDLGKSILNSIVLYYNIVKNKNIILKIYDTQSLANIAEDIAKKAIKEDNNKIIIGPIFSDEVEAVAGVSELMGIPLIVFSNNINILKNKNNVYLMSYLPNNEIERMISYAIVEKQAQNFAILAPNNSYGDVITISSIQTLALYGLSPIKIIRYPADEIKIAEYIEQLVPKDNLNAYLKLQAKYEKLKKSSPNEISPEMISNVNKLPKLDFEALIIGDFGKRLNIVGSHLAFSYIDYKNILLLGNSNWDNSNIINDSIFQNSYYPFYGKSVEFNELYQQTYGKNPTSFEFLGAEAIKLIASMFYKDYEGNLVADYTKANITSTNYKGILGNFRFREDGSIVRDMGVNKISYKKSNIALDIQGSKDFIKTNNYVNIESIKSID